MNRFIKAVGGMLLAATLAACGGGGGSPGATSSGGTTTPGTGTGTTTPPGTTAPVVSSFIFDLSKATLNNGGSDSSVLTVTALDAKNNPVSGAALSVSVDTGVYTPISSTTDASGKASGTITAGSNKANRNITASINLAGQTATAVVSVAGSSISLTPIPATPAPGTSTRVDIKVTDANGAGIPNTPVVLSGTLGLTGTVTTDSTGNASATLGAAPTTVGTYTVDAAALGVKTSRTVQVVSPSGGGGIPDAVGAISSASLSIVPNTISPNASGSTTSRASIRAKFLNASNQAVQNVRVRFEIVPPALGSGEQLSSGNAQVYSDVNGDAITDYIAGTRSSPTDGVVIRGCYGTSDAALAGGACPNSVIGTLTVAGQPLSITLGDNNELAKGTANLTYIKQFDVAVADAAGNAVANAIVSASVDITHYGKGLFAGIYPTGTTPPTLSDTFSATAQPGTDRVWCQNEDTSRNGALDSGEDINGNGKLEPRKADVILSFSGSNTTNASGRMTIKVEYPQNVATWLSYTVRVTTNVAGSEGTDSKAYITRFVEGDQANGSFLTAPYGARSCSEPN